MPLNLLSAPLKKAETTNVHGHDTDPLCTCFMVRSLSRKISQLYDDVLAPSGLRGTQFSLLAHARQPPNGQPMGVSVLAERLHTDRTTMTRNLRTLQDAGWIDLVPGKDARSRCVVLTSDGEVVFRQAVQLWRQAQSRVREICDDNTVDALELLVKKMLPRLSEKGGL